MKYILIAFNSRNLLYEFTKYLRYHGIQFSVINTPRAISISCGLSVKVGYVFYGHIMNVVTKNKDSIKGVYIAEKVGSAEKFQKIL